MGWFWTDPQSTSSSSTAAPVAPPASCPVSHHKQGDAVPPASLSPVPAKRTMPLTSSQPSCPMHNGTLDALSAASPTSRSATTSTSDSPPSSCPVPHNQRHSNSSEEPSQGILSKLNPLNYMFREISNKPAQNQAIILPVERDPSSIPKGSGDGNWEYPSPQQMYNALLRKGHTDTDITAVESMVSVHNFLNEGAWAEIVEWERRFGGGLSRAWEISKRGEENAQETQRLIDWRNGTPPITPALVRFQGRPQDMTPKAAMLQVMGWLYPAKFGTEPPFDRHDWYVARNVNGERKEVRYVIDYYEGAPEPTGEPVFYLDVRPALTPSGAAERMIRWGGDVWWRASGGEAREANDRPKGQ